jgi:hypothetical protein
MVTTRETSDQTGGGAMAVDSRFGVLREGPVNIMFYCHDSYGLGHLRRTLTLARWRATSVRTLSSSTMRRPD